MGIWVSYVYLIYKSAIYKCSNQIKNMLEPPPKYVKIGQRRTESLSEQNNDVKPIHVLLNIYWYQLCDCRLCQDRRLIMPQLASTQEAEKNKGPFRKQPTGNLLYQLSKGIITALSTAQLCEYIVHSGTVEGSGDCHTLTVVLCYKSICWFPLGCSVFTKPYCKADQGAHTLTGLSLLPLRHMQTCCTLHHGTLPWEK